MRDEHSYPESAGPMPFRKRLWYLQFALLWLIVPMGYILILGDMMHRGQTQDSNTSAARFMINASSPYITATGDPVQIFLGVALMIVIFSLMLAYPIYKGIKILIGIFVPGMCYILREGDEPPNDR